MDLYIPLEQRNSMDVEYCLRCQKMRRVAFMQSRRITPIRVAVDKQWMKDAVSLPAFCDCSETSGKEKEEKPTAYAVILDRESDMPDGYFLDHDLATRFLGDSPGEIFECEVTTREWMETIWHRRDDEPGNTQKRGEEEAHG